MNSTAPVALVGRFLLALMFLIAGIGKFAALEGTAGYIASKGLPMPQLLAVATAALEVVGGVALIVGWHARVFALLLAGFTALASILFHGFWAMPAEQQMMQQLMFMKNLSVVGGLLLVFALGAGGFSLDARRTAAA